MLKNYFKIAFRNLFKYKLYSFINIFGLAVGLASCIIILVFITDELSYDKYHSNSKNIYRVVTDLIVGGHPIESAVTSFPMAAAFKKDYPEVKESGRLIRWGDPVIKYEENKFKEKNFLWADNSVLNIFSFEFLNGNAGTALINPDEVVITESSALKYFGNDNPVGKTLLYNNSVELKVTGVIKDVPSNSHFTFDMLGSFLTLEKILGKEYTENWLSLFRIYTYVVLPDNFNYKTFEEKLPGFIKNYLVNETALALGRNYKLHVQPLEDIHLRSLKRSELGSNGSLEQIYIISIIALFILLIACINFTNLSTARSIKRAGEVGLRKVLGAERKQLILQFVGESFISSLIAIPAAMGLAELFLPSFNSITGKNLTNNFLGDINFILAGIIFISAVSFFAGFYPAFILSRCKPAVILKSGSGVTSKRSSSFVRRSLIVLQFSISIFLVICTAIVFNQLDYIRNKDIGIDKEQVIVIPSGDELVNQKLSSFRNSLIKNKMITSVSASSFLPGKSQVNTPYRKHPDVNDEKYELATLPVDHEFFKTLDIKVISGRSYSAEITTDTVDAFLINETAARQFGWTNEEAIGKKLIWDGAGPVTGTIIGVTEDFLFQSIHNKISPLVFVPKNLWPLPEGFISVKSAAENISSSISFLKSEWDKFFSHVPFEYTFLDDDFAAYYSKEEKTGKVFTVFASLAIFIACLGLFGLSAYSVETKTKEIGIRKVLGSSVPGIVKLISTEFIILVLLANLIAWPAAYFFMKSWLEDFAYKIDINFSLFIFASVTAVIIALATVSYHSIRAANTNPVKALKYE